MSFLVVTLCVVGTALTAGLHYSIPLWLAALAGVNVATAYLYAYDKAVAGGESRRVPESQLHLHALLGGSPAALLSQVLFRHKTAKAGFRAKTWLIFALQAAAAAGIAFLLIENRPR
jgi:uncharacterized membrane protein YsdA (DUF1294 family)